MFIFDIIKNLIIIIITPPKAGNIKNIDSSKLLEKPLLELHSN